MQPLNDEELLRYDRQITLSGFDIDKQERLKNSSALIIGIGGLGCAASLYLSHAGIGKLTLVDFDTISFSNLNRQILYTSSSIGKFKAIEAKKRLEESSTTVIEAITKELHDNELNTLIESHDVVVDCTDNLSSRKQLNRLCYMQKKPLVSGAAIRMEALLTVFTYQEGTACYECLSHLFGHQSLSCVEMGVMAPLVGMIGSMQALETIKVITHYGSPLSSRLLMIDAMTMEFNEISLPKWDDCDVCGK